jgi:hypothetical protein
VARGPIANRGAAMKIQNSRHARASHESNPLAPRSEGRDRAEVNDRSSSVTRVVHELEVSLRADDGDATPSAMIAHVVLFKLRPDLSAADADLLTAALDRALRDIPSVRRAVVGERVRIGAAYEQLPQPDLPYAAIIEFDDREGLHEYLTHAAHEEVARRFWASIQETMVFDFEMEQQRR